MIWSLLVIKHAAIEHTLRTITMGALPQLRPSLSIRCLTFISPPPPVCGIPRLPLCEPPRPSHRAARAADGRTLTGCCFRGALKRFTRGRGRGAAGEPTVNCQSCFDEDPQTHHFKRNSSFFCLKGRIASRRHPLKK